jgi:phospholipid transport system substrate-binding protein
VIDHGRSRAGRCAAAAACAIAIAVAAIAQATPKEVVDTMSSRVLEILRDDALSTEEKRGQVEEVIYRHVDFETLSRLVMARNWRKLSDAQKSDFMNEFKRHLSDTYGENVDNYRNEKVAVLSSREEKRGDVTVKSKILRGGTDDVMVDYRLRRKNEQWHIIDVVIEGVSLVANFRSQFQEIMSNGGPERLLKLLREKNVGPPPGPSSGA